MCGVDGASYGSHLTSLFPLEPMTPTTAIAPGDRLRQLAAAGGGVCYGSFTLKGLFAGSLLRILRSVMTEDFTSSERGSGRARRGIYGALSFSARNLLFVAPIADLQALPTDD